MNRQGSVRTRRKTVSTQTMRKRQMPSMVISAGRREYPMPRMTPAGTSYRPHTGPSASTMSIRWQAASITVVSEEKIPENACRQMTSGVLMMLSNSTEPTRQSTRIRLHRCRLPAA